MIQTFFGVFAITGSTFLFLRRLHAVYNHERRVRWFFSLFWAINVMAEFTVPFGIKPTPIPGTHFYRESDIRPYVGISGILLLIYDTSVFLAISYKVATSNNSTDERVRWNTIVSGKALPRLCRAILRGGQQYYLYVRFDPSLVFANLTFIQNDCWSDCPHDRGAIYPLH